MRSSRFATFSGWFIAVIFAAGIFVSIGLLVDGRSENVGKASVSLLGYTNVDGARRAVFVVSNGYAWPVDFLAGMPEVKTSTGWHDLWTNKHDYRLMLEIERHTSQVFTQPVPTNAEPTRIRFLCYRADTGLRGIAQRARDKVGLDPLDDYLDKVYSDELIK